jgi:predicted MFS family arabinose efflux permease
VALFGFSIAIFNTIFNNFLSESFNMGNLERGVLELPREMPGFLVVFVSLLLFFLPGRRLAALSHLLAALGVLLIGHFSSSYPIMLIWLFVFSMGQHLFLPLMQSIGMEFAHGGKTGKRLGQFSAVSNLAAITGSFIIFIGFRFFNFNFSLSFTIAAAGLLVSSVLLYSLKPDEKQSAKSKFILRREYGLFYWLNILYGTRKQLFITFAPWVLVTVYGKSTSIVATLMTIGGIVGIVFNPLLGRAIDRFGERRVLMMEAVLLVFVCMGYGFAKIIFSETTAFIIASVCFIADQLLMYVTMARSTYLKKIAVKPSDVNPTLTMGVSIDHIFSISIALVSGLIWSKLGYQYVFILGAIIAVVNFFSASRVRVPQNAA